MFVPFVSPASGEVLIREGDTLKSNSGEIFRIVNGIPRFVSSDSYAAAFGHQWKTHPRIQLDSYNGSDISKLRLIRCLGSSLESFKGKTILEAGSGAGRFTEHLVAAGAFVHSFDLSIAVEVNRENIGEKDNYRIFQADILNMPFKDDSFDVVMCLGVIQHTPSPEKTIEALFKKVKPGGLLVIDHYTFNWMYLMKPLLIYRFFLKRMKPAKSEKCVKRLVDFFFPLHWKFRNSSLMRILLNRISPCYIYFRQFPNMDKDFHYGLALLDTYDGLTDYYKHLRSTKQVKSILENLKAKSIEVWKGGNGVEARCRK
ncbi:MAG: class I SAM-dependent methyltransferase [Bacteroidia bacterium]|nr:class I SAM-dependent methyltransferase [Bacteroidia bacterium]